MIKDLMVGYKKIKEASEMISEAGYVVNVIYNGETLVSIGAGVKPFMFGVAGDIEVKDMDSAMEMAKSMNMM